jgi:Holliday junction resolvasome RuvABC endonuclease subunit
MNIIGIDLGSVKTGITYITGDLLSPKFETRLIKISDKEILDTRFTEILKTVTFTINARAPELVVCEYPFNIKGNAKILVEMFGVIHFHCLYYGYLFLPLPQTKIKKYATGKGDAEKSDIRMQVYKEFNLDLSEDEADSFFIAHFGMSYLYGTENKLRQKSVDDLKAPKKKKRKKKNGD